MRACRCRSPSTSGSLAVLAASSTSDPDRKPANRVSPVPEGHWHTANRVPPGWGRRCCHCQSGAGGVGRALWRRAFGRLTVGGRDVLAPTRVQEGWGGPLCGAQSDLAAVGSALGAGFGARVGGVGLGLQACIASPNNTGSRGSRGHLVGEAAFTRETQGPRIGPSGPRNKPLTIAPLQMSGAVKRWLVRGHASG